MCCEMRPVVRLRLTLKNVFCWISFRLVRVESIVQILCHALCFLRCSSNDGAETALFKPHGDLSHKLATTVRVYYERQEGSTRLQYPTERNKKKHGGTAPARIVSVVTVVNGNGEFTITGTVAAQLPMRPFRLLRRTFIRVIFRT